MLLAVEQLSLSNKKEPGDSVLSALRPRQMIQSVKAICAFLGSIETLEVQNVCEKLIEQCLEFDQAKGNVDPSGRISKEILEQVRSYKRRHLVQNVDASLVFEPDS